MEEEENKTIQEDVHNVIIGQKLADPFILSPCYFNATEFLDGENGASPPERFFLLLKTSNVLANEKIC